MLKENTKLWNILDLYHTCHVFLDIWSGIGLIIFTKFIFIHLMLFFHMGIQTSFLSIVWIAIRTLESDCSSCGTHYVFQIFKFIFCHFLVLEVLEEDVGISLFGWLKFISSGIFWYLTLIWEQIACHNENKSCHNT